MYGTTTVRVLFASSWDHTHAGTCTIAVAHPELCSLRVLFSTFKEASGDREFRGEGEGGEEADELSALI